MRNVPKSSTARLVIKTIKPKAKTGAQLMLPNQAKHNQTAQQTWHKAIQDRKIRA